MSEDKSSGSNFGCVVWVLCLTATATLLAVKYAAAPTIPVWVCLLPLIPIALQVTILLGLFIFMLGCFMIAGIAGGIASCFEGSGKKYRRNI